MGKYDDLIGSVTMEVSVKEVLDEQAAEKVDSQIKKHKKKLEEPVKVKLDLKDADRKIKRLNAQMTELESAGKKIEKSLTDAISGGDSKSIAKEVREQDKLQEQLAEVRKEREGINRELHTYQKELKAAREGTRKLSEEEKKVNALIDASKTARPARKPRAKKTDSGDAAAAATSEANANEKLAESIENVDGAKKKSRSKKTKSNEADSVKKEADAYNKLADAVEKSDDAKKKSRGTRKKSAEPEVKVETPKVDTKQVEKQIEANKELAQSYEEVAAASAEATKQIAQEPDTSGTDKQIEKNEELVESYEEVQKEVKNTIKSMNGRALKIFDVTHMTTKTKKSELRRIKGIVMSQWKNAHGMQVSEEMQGVLHGNATLVKKDGASLSFSKNDLANMSVGELKKALTNIVYAIFEDDGVFSGSEQLFDTHFGNLLGAKANHLGPLFYESGQYIKAYREEVLKLYGAILSVEKDAKKSDEEKIARQKEILAYEELAQNPDKALAYDLRRREIDKRLHENYNVLAEQNTPQMEELPEQISFDEKSQSDRELEFLEANLEYYKKRKELIQENIALVEEYNTLPFRQITGDEYWAILSSDMEDVYINDLTKQLQSKKLELVSAVETYEEIVDKVNEYSTLKKQVAEIYKSGVDVSEYQMPLATLQTQLIKGIQDPIKKLNIMTSLNMFGLSDSDDINKIVDSIAEALNLTEKQVETLDETAIAFKKLKELSQDPYSIEDETEVNRIYRERLAIFTEIGDKKLENHNKEEYLDALALNEEYGNRIVSLKESKDDVVYIELDEKYSYDKSMMYSSAELETMLENRNRLMQDINFKSTEAYETELEYNKLIEQRLALMKELEPLYESGKITKDTMTELIDERGTLEERASYLSAIQGDISRDASDESSWDDLLDEAQLYLQQYEKILVTTASGKKLELGPEMSMKDYQAFLRMNTEKAKSIEFVRRALDAQTDALEENTDVSQKNIEVKKPELLQNIEVLEDREEMQDAKTVAQKRKAAEQMLRAQWDLYQDMKKEYDDPENATQLMGTDYDSLLRQQSTLEAYIALFEKYGGVVEKVGKKLKTFSDDLGYTGAYQYAVDEYEQLKLSANKAKEDNIVYHAGDLSNIDKTLKSFRLGNVAPRESGSSFNKLTGLYTTEDVDGFWANEWEGAPVSTIDLSYYKLFDARNNELATKAKTFFDNLNGTIYGYMEYFDEESESMLKNTNVKSIEDLHAEFKEVFNDINIDLEAFANFIKQSRAFIKGHSGFIDIELPAIDEGIAKSAQGIELQGVSQNVFNADSFQTQLLKMLGFEGIDLRGTKFDGTYTGGTVIFDIKPESVIDTNAKWSDVMGAHGYEIDKVQLDYEEKRRQLAFDTAKAYSRQVEESETIVKLVDNYGRELDEVNNKLLQGTKYLDEQSRVITLFHNSDKVFDKFDPNSISKSNLLGKGHYLSTSQTAYMNYGKFQTQFYANLQKTFDADANGMSTDDATKIIEAYAIDTATTIGKQIFDELTGSNALAAIGKIAESYNVDSTYVLKTAGYDSIKMSDEINVFDANNLFRANENVLNTNTADFKTFAKLSDEIELTKAEIQKLENDIVTLSEQEKNNAEAQLALEKERLATLESKSAIYKRIVGAETAQYLDLEYDDADYQKAQEERDNLIEEAVRREKEQAEKEKKSRSNTEVNSFIDKVKEVTPEGGFAEGSKELQTYANLLSKVSARLMTCDQAWEEFNATIKETPPILVEQPAPVETPVEPIGTQLTMMLDPSTLPKPEEFGPLKPVNQQKEEAQIIGTQIGDVLKDVLKPILDSNKQKKETPKVNKKYLEGTYLDSIYKWNNIPQELHEELTSEMVDIVDMFVKGDSDEEAEDRLEGLRYRILSLAKTADDGSDELGEYEAALYNFAKTRYRIDPATKEKNPLRIRYTPAMKADIGGKTEWNEFYKHNKHMLVGNQYGKSHKIGIDMDALWPDLQHDYGKHIFPDFNSVDDMFIHYFNLLDQARKIKLPQGKGILRDLSEQEEQGLNYDFDKNFEIILTNASKETLKQQEIQELESKRTEELIRILRDADKRKPTGHGYSEVYDGDGLKDKLAEFDKSVKENEALEITKVQVKEISNEMMTAVVTFQDKIAGITRKHLYMFKDGVLEDITTESVQVFGGKTFDKDGAVAEANSQVDKLQSKLGTVKYDLANIRKLANNISSDDDLKVFNQALKVANNEITALSQGTNTANSMSTFKTIERDMRTAKHELREFGAELKNLGNVSGLDKAQQKLDGMKKAVHDYFTATDAQGQQTAYNKYSQNKTDLKAMLPNLKDISSMEDKMRNFAIEVETAQAKLNRFDDSLKSFGEAQATIDSMRASMESFNNATSFEDKSASFKAYQDGASKLRAQFGLLSEEQKSWNNEQKESEQQTEKSEQSIREYYNELLKMVQAFNQLESKMNSLKLKNKDGILDPLLANLEDQIANLVWNINDTITAMTNQFPDVMATNIQLDTPSFFLKENFEAFYNSTSTQSTFTQEELDKLVNALKVASNEAEVFGNTLNERLSSVYESIKKLNSLTSSGAISADNQYYKGIQGQIFGFAEYIKGLPEDKSLWSAEQVIVAQNMANAINDNIASVEKLAQKEAEYFAGKQKNTANMKAYDETAQAIENAGNKSTRAKELLEGFVKSFSDGEAVITGFKTSADGISKIDFSMFDKTTQTFRTFSAEMGQFTNNVYTYETSMKNLSAGTDAAQKSLVKIVEALARLSGSDADMDQGNIKALIEMRDKLNNALKEKGSSKAVWDQTSLKNIALEANRSLKAVISLENSYAKLMASVESGDATLGGTINVNGNVYEQLAQQVNQYASSFKDSTLEIGKFDEKTGTLKFTLTDTDNTMKSMEATMSKLNGQVFMSTKQVDHIKTGWEEFGSVLKTSVGSFARYAFSMYDFVRYIRQGVTYVREIDAALTELKKVTDETDATYQKFLGHASKSASLIGSTIKDFTSVTADFARLGYSIEEASELAKTALVYENVGDGFSNVEEASESIISTMQAFGVEADNAMGIVDRFNAVGNNFAITSKGIGDALQRSASALFESGNTIDEAIALVTGANTVIQNPESVGNALKTLSLRLRGAKVELQEAGLDAENMASSVSTLRNKLLALTDGKVDIMIDENTFKSTTQILREMAEVWESLDDIDAAAALELMGGKRQANILSSLIKNFDTVEKVIETSMHSEGSALEENKKYLESIQGHIDILNNSFQTMWSNALNSDVIKFFVDLANILVKVADKMGLVNIATGALFAKMAYSKDNTFGSFFTGASLNNMNSGKWGKKTDSIINKLLGFTKSSGLSSTLGSVEDVANSAASGMDNLAQSIDDVSNNVVHVDFVQKQQIDSSKNAIAVNKGVQQTQDAVGTSAATASVGVKLLNAALSFGLGMLVAWASTKIIGWINDLVHKQELLNESANEVINTYSDAKKELSSMRDVINEVGSDFERLSDGVDEFGNNINLSTSEYERYNNIVNDIADMFPEMVTGYTKEGNAILKCKGNVEQLTEAYEAAAQAARQEAIAGSDDVFDAFKTNYDNKTTFVWEDSGIKQQQELAKQLIDLSQSKDTDGLFELLRDTKTPIIRNLFDAAGIDKSDYTKGIFGAWDEEKLGDFDNELNKLLSFVKTATTKINAETNKIKPIVDAYLEENSVKYATMNDKSRSIVDKLISNMSAEFINDFDSFVDLSAWVEDNFVNAFTDVNLTNTVGDMLDLQDQFKDGELPIQSYKEKFLDFVNELNNADIDPDALNQIKEFFNIDIANEESVGKDIDAMVYHVGELFGNNLNAELKEKILTLDYSDLKALDTIPTPSADDKAISSWRELEYVIEEAKKAMIQDFTASNISDYADDISSITDRISSLQSSYDSLMSGDFTYEDFLDLIQQFPELAEGVDASSDSFEGLAKNLRKAIKNAPDTLVDELKDLRKQLVSAGKSTDAIDQLISSVENLPTGKVDEFAEKYVTLTDAIEKANKAQGELEKAMDKNPNSNYENTSEAVQKMRDMYANGATGSESEIWDIFEALTGQTYDWTKSLDENESVMKDWLNVYSQFYLRNEGDRNDGEYAHQPIENFLNFMETKVAEAKEAGEEWALATTWTYENGTANIDYDNKYLGEMAKYAGFAESAFQDLMMQVAQFWAVKWEDGDDLVDYLKEINSTIEDPIEKMDKASAAMQSLLKESGISSDWLQGTDRQRDNLDSTTFSDDIKNALQEYWDLQYQIEKDPLGITFQLNKESDVSPLKQQMQEEFNETPIDLSVRPKVSAETMKLAGWDGLEDGDYATVHTATFEAGTFEGIEYAVNVTPILPNGAVINGGEDGLVDYINQQLASGKKLEELDIFLGSYETVEKAVEAADRLHILQEEYYAAIENNKSGLIEDDDIAALEKLTSVVKDTESNTVFINIDSLKEAAKEAGYTQEGIDELVASVNKFTNVVDLKITNDDPIGLNSISKHADAAINYLNSLTISASKVGDKIQIDFPSFISFMENSGWTTEQIQTYINSLPDTYTFSMDGGDITADVKTSDGQDPTEKLKEVFAKAQEAPDEEIKVDLTGNAQSCLDSIISALDKIKDKNIEVNVTEKYKRKTWSPFLQSWISFANGTMHSGSGSSFANGSIGAPKTEEALVGELGAEMRVRGNRWELIGQNGAEFTDVRKGDIIFNHKQTEELLKNGHITSRGNAYAHGTSGAAYAITSGTKDWPNYVSDINYRGELSDSRSGKDGNDSDDVNKEILDFIEIKLEEIDQHITTATAKLETLKDDTSQTKQKNESYDYLVNKEKSKANTNDKGKLKYFEKAKELFNQIPYEYRDLAQYGGIEIEDFIDKGDDDSRAKIVELINEYREWDAKAAEAEAGYFEAITQIAQYRVDQLQDIADDYENVIGLIETESSLLEAQMDLVEESGERIGSGYYTALIENSEETIAHLQNEKKDLQNILNESVASGDVKKGTDEWYEMVDAITSVDEQIINCNKDIESFQNAINDLKWDNLDKLIDRFDALDSELSHIYDRLTDDKVTDDDGNWNSKGIAAMGVAAQQMEVAQYKSQEYAQAIKDLTKDYKNGLYSTDEYNEKLTELKENQWESIEAYESAKDAIVDLNKTRVDAVKDGIEKELDAYKELIDAQKELLDAEKDLHDFEKSIEDQEKEISDIDRKLAALAGDNSMSANAERKRLEAERAEAQANLDELYYDRSIQNQQNALDTEYENYENAKNKEMEALDKWLENEEMVITESMNTVKANAETVLAEINNISNMYGVQISEELTKPWEAGSVAISGYKATFQDLSSAFSEELDKIIKQQKILQEQAEKTAAAMAKTIGGGLGDITGSGTGGGSNSPDTGALDRAADRYSVKYGNGIKTPQEERDAASKNHKWKVGETAIVREDTTDFSRDGGNGTKMADGVAGGTYEVLGTRSNGNEVLIGKNGIPTGYVYKHDLALPGYAKGTTGVKEDQWAWIDEIGEELVMHAGPDGKLSYLTKGTSVIPHDLTEKLMDLALDPTTALDNSRPVVSAPHVVNNEIHIDASIAELIHIDNVTNDTLPNFEKVVEKQMDKYIKGLNAQIRKFTR